jgi:hypothetical protein
MQKKQSCSPSKRLLFFGLLRIRAAEVALVEGEFPGRQDSIAVIHVKYKGK